MEKDAEAHEKLRQQLRAMRRVVGGGDEDDEAAEGDDAVEALLTKKVRQLEQRISVLNASAAHLTRPLGGSPSPLLVCINCGRGAQHISCLVRIHGPKVLQEASKGGEAGITPLTPATPVGSLNAKRRLLASSSFLASMQRLFVEGANLLEACPLVFLSASIPLLASRR